MNKNLKNEYDNIEDVKDEQNNSLKNIKKYYSC